MAWSAARAPGAVNANNRRNQVKKAWLMIALAALVGSAVSTFADVQNIRLSGDIRIRGYYTVNTDGDGSEEQAKNSDSYISQRTRVTVEADLEDHVLIVVTLKAEGLWGQENDANDSSGAGTDDVLDSGANAEKDIDGGEIGRAHV